MSIKRIIFIICFLFSTITIFGQGFSYSFTDPCTFKTKQIFINNPNGSVALIYNGQIQSFTPTQLQSGALEAWITQVNSTIPAGTGPCGGVALSQNTTMNALVTANTISVLNSVMSAMASIASMSSVSSSGGNMLQGVIQSGEKSASSNQKEEDKDKNNKDGSTSNGGGSTNNNGGSSTTSNNNQGNNSSGEGTGGNSNSQGQTNSTQNGESSSSSNSTEGGNSTSKSSVDGGSEKTNEEKVANVKSEEVKSSTQVKAKVSAVKQGNLMMTGDIVAISSASGSEPQQLKVNASIIKVNTENTLAKGALLNYTSVAQNTCITVFYALRSNGYTTTVANSTMLNTQKDFFNTISIMESYKSGKFTFTLGQNITTGKLGESKFKSLSTMAGAVTNFNITKSLGTTVMLVMVYSPYVYYYEGMWNKSGFMAVPFAAFDYRITNKFKLNLSFSGIQPINEAPLNYQILLGAKALL